MVIAALCKASIRLSYRRPQAARRTAIGLCCRGRGARQTLRQSLLSIAAGIVFFPGLTRRAMAVNRSLAAIVGVARRIALETEQDLFFQKAVWALPQSKLAAFCGVFGGCWPG